MTAAPAEKPTAQPPRDGLEEALWRAFEQSREALLITDRDQRIVAVNAAFCQETGYAVEELLGQDSAMLAMEQARASGQVGLRELLQTGGKWCGEIHKQRKDGSSLTQWLSVSALAGSDGVTRFHVANFTALPANDAATDRLAHLAYHDALTGLPNRLALDAQLGQALRMAERKSRQLALMLIDLDHFKYINDTLGHPVGDEVLRQVAQRLNSAVRASDLVARLGGDEFVVVLPEIDNPLTAARVANKIRDRLADCYEIDGHTLQATPSIGISLFPTDGHDAATLLRNADTAMYHAKNMGRNNHQFYASRMNATAGKRLKLEHALRLAVAGLGAGQREFVLHFQPVVDARSGRIVTLEALLRWHPADLGAVPPHRFLAIAEETGLIQPLGRWVIEESCRQIGRLRQQGIALPVAINLSAQQLRQDKLLALIESTLAANQLSPADIELEITESTAMHNPEVMLAILDSLGRMGVRLSIDNFGSGYSSLAYLKALPIRALKLDRSFVCNIDQAPDDAAICSATVALAHNLGLELVAVGVETEAQRDILVAKGCDYLQGYLYSSPRPLEELLPTLPRPA